MDCTCLQCEKKFESNKNWHHSTGLCSQECKWKRKRISQEKYKKTAKGRASLERWIKSEKCKNNDKRYRQTPRAKKIAVLRTMRFLERHPEYKEKRKIYQEKWIEKVGHEKYREINNEAVRKYRKTEAGRWVQKNYKYQSRNNKSGRINKEQWKSKLKQLDGKCQMCGTKEKITIDHIIPLSKGGTNISDNLQPLCHRCNCSKNNKV